MYPKEGQGTQWKGTKKEERSLSEGIMQPSAIIVMLCIGQQAIISLHCSKIF